MTSETKLLLELAAKAAGIDACWHVPESAYIAAENEGLWLKGARTPDNDRYWNPLTCDGDALRLAVQLGISIEPYPIYTDTKHSVLTKQRRPEDLMREVNPTECAEVYGDDAYASTRLAITRAAATIGEAMP